MIRRLGRVLPVLLGWLVLAFVLDVGLGLTLERLHPEDEVAPELVGATARAQAAAGGGGAEGSGGGGDAPAGPLSRTCVGNTPISEDNLRNASEPAAAAPWVLEFWCEFGRLSNDYLPFLFARTRDADQQLIHVSDGVRRSHQAATASDDVPVVWFFGGSTMWGWGQRDQHTIPSEVARLSEAAGLPVRVVNLANIAWVHWQDVLAFEQELAARPAPDLAVFYDGINETNVQGSQGVMGRYGDRPDADPTIYDFELDPAAPVPPLFGVPPPPRGDESLYERWADRSAIVRLARNLDNILGLAPAPAAAADNDGADEIPPTDTIVQRSLDVYERGRAIAVDLGERYGVSTHFYWQPRVTNLDDEHYRQARTTDLPPETRMVERAVVAGLTEPTVDLTGALNGNDPDTLFTDGNHTNERGAQLIAEAIWADLLPSVRGLYDARAEEVE